LIHLDHYYDWSPQLDLSLSSSASRLPDSSSSSSGGHHLVFQSFSWTDGVIDGRPSTHRSNARLPETCRLPLGRDQQDEDTEDD
jgi:hypothetical protein